MVSFVSRISCRERSSSSPRGSRVALADNAERQKFFSFNMLRLITIHWQSSDRVKNLLPRCHLTAWGGNASRIAEAAASHHHTEHCSQTFANISVPLDASIARAEVS